MKNGLFLLTLVLLSTTMSFGQKKVANYYNVSGYTEETAKSYFNTFEIDPIEGIWQSNDGFKYSIEKDVVNGMRKDDKYRVIILSHNTNSPFWKETYIKGFIEKTAANGVYNIDYYTAGQNYSGNTDIEVQTCIGLLEASALFTFTKQDGDKIILIKLYPKTENDNSGTFSSSNNTKSTGTGFAISSNGYIVTNHHVIAGAKSIEVKGVNGNFTRKLSAEIAVSDEKNDLAIIKINDPNFTTVGSIPYNFRQGMGEVGENVFVLGYPMTSSMGEEVKLTNGIISSKTGFQGDISMYQISAPVQPGNSGGPLFDKNGNLLGIVSAKHSLAENAGYAIKVSYLKNLIEMLPQTINQTTVNILNGKGLTEQVKIASNYTYLILINDNSNSFSNSNVNSNQKKSSTQSQNAIAYFQKASEDWKNKNSQSALLNINTSIELDPNNPDAYGFRGFIYLFGIRNFDEAIKDFTKILQMKYEDANSYYYRGLCYAFLKNDNEAIKDFTSCLKYDSHHTDALLSRSFIKRDFGDNIGAIDDLKQLLNYFDERPLNFGRNKATVFNEIAWNYYLKKEYNKTIEYVNQAIDLDKENYNAWDTRGCAYYELQEYQNCIRDLDKAISINKESKNSYYYRGLAKIAIAKKNEGCADFSKAGELGEAKAYEAIKQYCK